MANGQDNLIPASERSLDEVRENGRKGGVASGKARRQKANLRKIAQEVLDGTFTDIKGREVTGTELVIKGLVQNLSSPNGKNWGKAVDLLVMLTGAGMSPEQRANLKAATDKIKAETKRINGDDSKNNGMLEDLIKGLQSDDLHTETESPHADVAEGAAETNKPS